MDLGRAHSLCGKVSYPFRREKNLVARGWEVCRHRNKEDGECWKASAVCGIGRSRDVKKRCLFRSGGSQDEGSGSQSEDSSVFHACLFFRTKQLVH